ncbi:MAG TPA: Gfo/Idh/MocA family oxidoreductase [Firmicutes bacterium]|nr:Gfo/Idh/MocA family oxidoreductase [Bacillota bacterium]
MKEIRVGVLGYGLMGKVHSHAYRVIPVIYDDHALNFTLELACLCGRSREAVSKRAASFGFKSYETDWRAMVDRDDIDVFDNCGPDSVHVEPTIRAAESGKHVVCEKPLALTTDDAYRMLEAVKKAGVKHLCGFHLRFLPAIQLARRLLDKGALGRVLHVRAAFLEDPVANTDLFARHRPGPPVSGTIGDLGSHAIDLLRFLIGEPEAVAALTRDVVQSEEVSIDDVFVAIVAFKNGVIGTLEASKFAIGRRSSLELQIYGEKGSMMFDLASLNYLRVHMAESGPQDLDIEGTRHINVTDPTHPYAKYWWGAGHGLGWGDAFVNELFHFVSCVVDGTDISPLGATFEDGYKAVVITDALARSARSRKEVSITY